LWRVAEVVEFFLVPQVVVAVLAVFLQVLAI
jgi:hypothetical protein